MSFYSGTPKFCLGLLLFLLEESRTPDFKILVRSLPLVNYDTVILLHFKSLNFFLKIGSLIKKFMQKYYLG